MKKQSNDPSERAYVVVEQKNSLEYWVGFIVEESAKEITLMCVGDSTKSIIKRRSFEKKKVIVRNSDQPRVRRAFGRTVADNMKAIAELRCDLEFARLDYSNNAKNFESYFDKFISSDHELE